MKKTFTLEVIHIQAYTDTDIREEMNQAVHGWHPRGGMQGCHPRGRNQSQKCHPECHHINPEPGMGHILHPSRLGQPGWGAALLGRKGLGLWASSKLSLSHQPGLAAGMASTSQAV